LLEHVERFNDQHQVEAQRDDHVGPHEAQGEDTSSLEQKVAPGPAPWQPARKAEPVEAQLDGQQQHPDHTQGI
jgi:hypothetical protein